MTRSLLERAAQFIDCKDACDCEMCELGRDIRSAIPTIPTLHRWYRPSLYPRTNHAALVMAGAHRPEARL